MGAKLKKLEAWLEQDPTRITLLAYGLRYTTSTTIDQWRRRKQIPKWAWPTVEKVIKSKTAPEKILENYF